MKKRLLSLLLALIMVFATVASAVAVSVEVPFSNHNIKEVVYYDKTPDPNVNEEMKNYPAVWMLYDDPDNHENIEVFTLKPVATEEEAENQNFGIKGFKIDGKWYKAVALWTVNPAADIIDKGNGEKAVFTPLYYTDADKPQPGDKLNVALYDYDSGAISNLVEVEIPGEGGETHVVVDDKTVAPPQEIVLTYNGQAQECPYHDTDGYYVTLNDPQTDAGLYTAALLLRDGWKWTDGTTAGKIAVWAINPAPLTAVTLVKDKLAYDGTERHPEIASVNAGTLVAPAGSYTASFPDESILPGTYTVTVKGKGNFTGSASTEYIIYTESADTCDHSQYERIYKDNGDGKTHTEYCSHCGATMNNAQPHTILTQSVVVDGVYCVTESCTLCDYKTEPVECTHEGHIECKDNGNGTHTTSCTRCTKVLVANEAHTLKIEPIKTTVSGVELYLGQYVASCEKCNYSEEKTCNHEGTERVEYQAVKTTATVESHAPHCGLCKMLLLEEEESCTSDENWVPHNFNGHKSHCTKCGQEMKANHDFKGTRKITKVDVIPYSGGLFNMFTRYNYRVHYKETCKVCQGTNAGFFPYIQSWMDNWGDYRDAFEMLSKLNPDELQSIADNDILGWDKYYIIGIASMLGPLYEATGTNTLDFATLNYDVLLNCNFDPSQEGSIKLFDKDGKEIKSYKPKDKNRLPMRDGEDEGISEEDFYRFDFTADDGAAVAVSTNYLMELPDGEHSFTVCFTTGNGEKVAMTILFEIETVRSAGVTKRIKNVHPAGTMYTADGSVVTMNLSATELAYTGEPIEPPAVVLTNEMGVEYAEDEDYTLTWYRIVGLNGETAEVEVDPENIVEVGNYVVVATPTRNGVLFGEAYACFEVVEENALWFVCDSVNALDDYVVEDGVRLYPVNVKVLGLPDGALDVSSTQLFLNYDPMLLELRKFEGPVDWTVTALNGTVSAAWASETPVSLKDGDFILTLYFAAMPWNEGEYAELLFTEGASGAVSGLAFADGDTVTEIAAETVDGGIWLEAPKYGDVNDDGIITAADAALVLRALVGLSELTPRGAVNADVDGDGTVTAADAAAILRYVVGLIDLFPVQMLDL